MARARLGYRCLDDWYRVKRSDFIKNYGLMLVRCYRSSASAAVTDLIARREWCEWKFTRVPPGFWDSVENRRRYVRWLGKQLGYLRQEDWRQVRWRHFYDNYGGSLIMMCRDVWGLLEECFPQWDWKPYLRSNLAFNGFSEWADSYFAKHGQWPGRRSGPIAGTLTTWHTVATALQVGVQGLPWRDVLNEVVKPAPRNVEEARSLNQGRVTTYLRTARYWEQHRRKLAAEIKTSLGSKGAGVIAIPGLVKIEKKKVPARKAQTGVPNPFKPGELMDRPAKPAYSKVKVRVLKQLREMAK